jgi:hypothetical protein
MKQFDIHDFFNLFHFKSRIQVNLILKKIQSIYILSCDTLIIYTHPILTLFV